MFLSLIVVLNTNWKNKTAIFVQLNEKRKLPFAHFKDKEPSLVHLLAWTGCLWKQVEYNKVIFKLKKERQVYEMKMWQAQSHS